MCEEVDRRTVLVGGLACVMGAAPATGRPAGGDEGMQALASAFLATLDPARLARARLPFDAPLRKDWHYVPRDRHGIPLSALSADQRSAALRLLQASLSPAGYTRVETIRSLEAVLREVEHSSGSLRDPENYSVCVFGAPGPKGRWAWRFEGHHVSLHWTVADGRVIATTPQFLGANPAEVREGHMKGVQVLRAEDEIGRRLAASLTPEQSRAGIVAAVAPPEILSANVRRAVPLDDVGIGYRALRPEQQGMLVDAVKQHASVQTDGVARARLAALRRNGLDAVKFAWMGGLRPGQGHYYRIQGSEFLIELDNTQNDANHVHTVWRDFRGDWGPDPLADHYRDADHHRA